MPANMLGRDPYVNGYSLLEISFCAMFEMNLSLSISNHFAERIQCNVKG